VTTQMKQRKRIAIYGGTFDPVHQGHIEIARRVTRLFEIDEFLLVPARVAPHKVDRAVSSAFHRYAMLALATNDEPRISVSTVELDSAGPQYTVDTLARFRSSYEGPIDLAFVLGADSWSELTTWREWQRLITLANLIVVTRPGFEIRTDHVDSETASRITDLRGAEHREISPSGNEHKIYITDAVQLAVSATEIRQAAANDEQKLDSLVPPEVATYIRKYRLYRNQA
jgi:nicotinate-nucleotide adenylyltransferase